MSTTFDMATFGKRMEAAINAAFIETAEPIIEKALGDIEDAFRATLAKMALAQVDADYDLYRDGMNVIIRVKHNG